MKSNFASNQKRDASPSKQHQAFPPALSLPPPPSSCPALFLPSLPIENFAQDHYKTLPPCGLRIVDKESQTVNSSSVTTKN